MKSKLLATATTYSARNYGCDDIEVGYLSDFFERMLTSLSSSVLRKGVYDLVDFEGTKELGIDSFSLTIMRTGKGERPEWNGLFEAADRKLEIAGTLE